VAKEKKSKGAFQELRNKKAFHNYIIEDKYEAGIVLTGTEVKSIRAGKAQITEAFVRVENGDAILYHAHIDEYKFGNVNNHNPLRPRKLLLHKAQINKLQSAIDAGGCTVVPLRLYFKGALVKVEIAVGKGKKLHDKRDSIKKKEASREAERAMKFRRK